jgi:nucleotide-binding universal stress UspA family protein
MFKHILVPLEYPALSTIVLRTAASLAHEENAKITLLHVVDMTRDFYVASFAPIDERDLDRHYARIGSFLEYAATIAGEYGMNGATTTHVASGTPVDAVINATAATLGADVIVMRTHGRHGLARAWIGSITEAVIRDAAVPVLVIHESSDEAIPATLRS